jgi:hypothetical protein
MFAWLIYMIGKLLHALDVSLIKKTMCLHLVLAAVNVVSVIEEWKIYVEGGRFIAIWEMDLSLRSTSSWIFLGMISSYEQLLWQT